MAPRIFARMLLSVATAFEDGDLARQGAANVLHSTSPAGLAAYNRASAAIDLTRLLPQLTARALVIHEPGFPFGAFDLCQEVAAGIRDAQFVIVEQKSIGGRAHEGHVTATDQFRAPAQSRRVRRAGLPTRSSCQGARRTGTAMLRPDDEPEERWQLKCAERRNGYGCAAFTVAELGEMLPNLANAWPDHQ
jgi:hypothetical protein